MKSLIGLTCLAGALFLIACAPASPGGSEATRSAPTPVTSPSPQPVVPLEQTLPPAAENMVRLSIEHLSRRLGIPAEQIGVMEVTAVTWKDASLGCPKPGIDYLRVETPGFSIELEAGGSLYTYHTDEARRVVACGSRSSSSGSPTP